VTPFTYWLGWFCWSLGALIALALLLYFVVTKPIVAALLAGKGQ
jgi:hypothetical protein